MIESALKRGGTEDVFFHLSKSCTDEAKAHKAALMEDTGALPVKKLLRVAIHDHLVAFTEQEHAPIMAACEDAGLQCTSFWITNTVFAKDAPVDFIKKVMAEKKMDIKKVNGNKEYSVIDNVEGASMDEKFEVSTPTPSAAAPRSPSTASSSPRPRSRSSPASRARAPPSAPSTPVSAGPTRL